MITGIFRASYTYVFQPQTPVGGGEPKYQITMLIPKSDNATYSAIMAEITQTLQSAIPTTFGGQAPAMPKLPIHDGDLPKASGEPWGDECRGHWVMRASSKSRPTVVDVNMQPILDINAFYSGCFARASINFFAYSSNGNKGIGCGLNNLQKIADGESLAGRSSAEDDFGGANAWGGAAPQYAPAYAPAPVTPVAPAYPAPVPTAAPQGYTPAPMPGYAPAPATPQYAPAPAAIPQINPVTGLPMVGGVMGI